MMGVILRDRRMGQKTKLSILYLTLREINGPMYISHNALERQSVRVTK